MKFARSPSVVCCVVLCVLCSACLRLGYGRRVAPPSAGRGGSHAAIDAGVQDAGRARDAGPITALDAGTDGEPAPEPDASPYIPEETAGSGGSTSLPVDEEDAGSTQPDPMASAGAGGIIAADGGMGGTGGTAPTIPARSCAHGSELGGYCWFLGATGISCNDVCQDYGGYDAALSWVGTTQQGGSAERCDQLLTMLTSPGTTTKGRRSDGRGLGCHLYYDVRWWLNDPDFDPAAKWMNSRIVCSCVDP